MSIEDNLLFTAGIIFSRYIYLEC